MKLSTFCLLLSVTAVLGAPVPHDDDYTPQQIHLTITSKNTEMVVQWVSFEPLVKGLESLIQYGSAATNMTEQTTSTPFEFTDHCGKVRLIHNVILTGLTPGVQVFYQVTSHACFSDGECIIRGAWSDVYNFTTIAENKLPLRVALFGDMGDQYNTSSVPQLIRDTHASKHDIVVHFGDTGYNLDDNCGQRGDDYMNAVQPFAALTPYVVGVGNHEQDVQFSYQNYLNRFSGQHAAATASGSPSVRYFSFDLPLVHVAMFDTDAWVYPEVYHFAEPQYKWLKEDLAKVDRKKTPWLVVLGHRSMYCTKSVDPECNGEAEAIRYGIVEKITGIRRFGIEELLHSSRADLYLGGHTHHYERTWPVYKGNATQMNYDKPQATVHIQSGIAGVDGRDEFTVPQQPWEAFRDMTYLDGYGRLTIFNASTLLYEQHLARDGSIADQFYLRK